MNSALSTRASLRERFEKVRALSDWIADPVSGEDAAVQSMPDASPLKWHLAHTTWFYETFLLEPHAPDYRPFDPAYRVLFNSYYNGVGQQHSRSERGLVTRPGLDEVRAYRRSVDTALVAWLEARSSIADGLASILELGLNHEQQHQELMLMDLKHLLSRNPLNPVYRPRASGLVTAAPLEWVFHEGGLYEIGHSGRPGDGFHFDNEAPRHKTYLGPFAVGSRPVTNGEYLRFMEAGGYEDPQIWLADGWSLAQREGWEAPLYWRRAEQGHWEEFTLAGMQRMEENEPVCHVSHFEAAAFAQWNGCRLPTEAEWEIAAASAGCSAGASAGRFLSVEGETRLQPGGATKADPQQWSGDVWEWTASAYLPYPGFQPLAGALGEYNGKFMSNQQVLRGGCCVTPAGHTRWTYRNFFYPHMRWQFGGIRLAKDA